ncbi:MAG: N-acetyltransferase [Candidatus Lokiarchaeota archaeon]|nr:N-acetyltransferase [Candidatus Lokiarchaeota archaeon]
MKIDNVDLKDLDEIYDLERRTFKKDAFSKKLILNLIVKNTFFFKLVDGESQNNIVGFIIIIQDREDRVNLVNFLIEKKHQKKGCATYLLNFTISKIKQLDKIKSIVLNVNSKNEVAINLYQKLNFRIVQKIENYYRQKESAYLMVLNI